MPSDVTSVTDLARLVEALPEAHLLCRSDGAVLHLNGAARQRVGEVTALVTPDGPSDDVLREALAGWARSGSMRPARVLLQLGAGVVEEVRARGARVGEGLLLVRLDEGPGSSSFSLLNLQRRNEHVEAVRRRLEQALADLAGANTQLERQNEALLEYAAFVSHDLRAPLAVVRGALELLEEETDPEVSEQLMQAALRAVDHAQDAATAVLDLIRFAPEPAETPTDLGAVVRGVADTVPGISVDETACRGQQVLVPALHLERLFRNLLENALRYRAADREPAVAVGATRRDGRVVVRVTDNGRGIVDVAQSDVFTLFRRGRSDDSEGSGVGLASCRRIVLAYGGDISVESDGVSGSTFVLDLPAPRAS